MFQTVFLVTALLLRPSNGQKNKTSGGDEPEYPANRYTPWSGLTEASESAAKTLFYNETLWNLPGSNAVELQSYETTINKTNPKVRSCMEAAGRIIQQQ